MEEIDIHIIKPMAARTSHRWHRHWRVRQIPGQQDGRRKPGKCRYNTSYADPLPARLTTARTEPVKHRRPDNDKCQEYGPPERAEEEVRDFMQTKKIKRDRHDNNSAECEQESGDCR